MRVSEGEGVKKNMYWYLLPRLKGNMVGEGGVSPGFL